MRRAVAILILGSATWAFAQEAGQPPPSGPDTQQRTFGAASVKRNRSNGLGVPRIVAVQAGRLIAPYTTVRELIRVGYEVDESQVLGGPGWIGVDRFEVNATVPPDVQPAAAREMLRKLLAERFELVAHRESRQLPAYILTFARSDHQLGERMRPAGAECRPVTPPAGVPLPPPPPPPPAGISGLPPIILSVIQESEADGKATRPCGGIMAPGHISLRNVGFTGFVGQLRLVTDRPLVDRTGITGRFDVDLTYTPDTAQPVGQPSFAPADAPVLVTAIQEQLGLKLESTRLPIEVVVVDRVSPPTEN